MMSSDFYLRHSFFEFLNVNHWTKKIFGYNFKGIYTTNGPYLPKVEQWLLPISNLSYNQICIISGTMKRINTLVEQIKNRTFFFVTILPGIA